MRLEEIDAIGIEPAQRTFDGGPDTLARKNGAFRGNQDLLPLSGILLEPAADQGFRFAALVAWNPPRVSLGGIHERKAGIDERIQKHVRHRLVDGPAEDTAAQGNR